MNPSRSLRTTFLVSLLGCCHLCVGFSTKSRSRDVGADEGGASDLGAGLDNVACGVFCLLAIILTVLTLPAPNADDSAVTSSTRDITPTASETREELTEPTAATEIEQPDLVDLTECVRTRRVRSSEVKEKWTTREGWSAFKPKNPQSELKPHTSDCVELATDHAESDNDQDLLLSVIHQLTTFNGNDCSDILLCAEEPMWDETMDEVLCDTLSCAIESMRDSSVEHVVDDSDGEATTAEVEVETRDVVVSADEYRDLMSQYTLQDTVCQGVPAMSPIDSVVSISSNSLCSSLSIGSDSLTTPLRTRKMSPQPNAEWAIME